MYKPEEYHAATFRLIEVIQASVQIIRSIRLPKCHGLLLVLIFAYVVPSSAQENFQLINGELQSETPLEEAQRIVSLAPHITELLFAVGAGQDIVGTVSYSDYPTQAKQIPRIGGHDKFNYEAILTLNPTLVIAWDSGNGSESINRLKQLGLRVYHFESRNLENVATSLEVLGELTKNTEQGLLQASLFRQRLDAFRLKYAGEKPVSVYYQLWNEPQMTVNDAHLISDVIRLCGGLNIFADAAPLVPKVGIESIVRRAPEVIIAAANTDSPPQWLDDWQNWSSIPAVKTNNLHYVHSDLLHRHGPRILDGTKQVCEILSAAR